MFGLDICDSTSWVAYASLWAFAILLTLLAAKISKRECQEKKDCGYNFTQGDQDLNPKRITKLVLVAYFAAFFSAMSGVGPGGLFTSFLIQIEVHPAVASATGMYCTMFTTLAATINLLLNNGLNIPYFLLISALTIVGTIPGVLGQVAIVTKTGGRNSFTVAILLSFLFICLVTVLPLSIVETMRASDNGEDVTAFSPYCL